MSTQGVEYDRQEISSAITGAMAKPECLSKWELTFCQQFYKKFSIYKNVPITEKQMEIIKRIDKCVKADLQLMNEDHIDIARKAMARPGTLTRVECEFVMSLASKDFKNCRLNPKQRSWLYSIHEKISKAA